MIHLLLFLLILVAGFSHAVMDCITFIRIHLARHPFCDGWHLAQWIRIGCYLGIGYLWPRSWKRARVATLIVAVCAIVLGRYIWDAVIYSPSYWLDWDTSVHISTGWAALDRLLGFHN